VKIITIEEHVSDAALAQACAKAQSAESPYMAVWAREADDGAAAQCNMPQILAAPVAMSLARNMGAQRLVEMDANGIDMQILSYSNSPQLLAGAEAVELTRNANDTLADAVNAHPDRFGGFATLPWSDPEAAAAELERAVTQLGFKGAMLTGRPGETFLDDPRYSPVLAAAEALNVPIYTHPGVPLKRVQEAYYAGLDPSVSARLSMFGWGWHAEAGVQIIRMILAGVFDKYPRLNIIAGHWGRWFRSSCRGWTRRCRRTRQVCHARSQTHLPSMSTLHRAECSACRTSSSPFRRWVLTGLSTPWIIRT